MSSSSLVTNCVKAAEYVGPMIGTACRWVGYLSRLTHIGAKAATVYANAQGIRRNPHYSSVDYMKVGAGVLLTGVEAISLAADLRTNMLIGQTSASAQKMNGELGNLKEVSEELEQAATQAKGALGPHGQLAQQAMSEIHDQSQKLHLTDDVATDMLNACLSLHAISKKTRELEAALQSQCAAGTENLLTATNAMNATVARLDKMVREHSKLSEQLNRVRDLQTVCILTEFVGAVTEEASHQGRFSSPATNADLTLKGVRAYVTCRPESRPSQFIKEHDLLTISESLCGTQKAFAQVANASRQLANPPVQPQPAAQRANFHDIRDNLEEDILERIENDAVLSNYICPLTHTVMRSPMILIAEDGHSFRFDRHAIHEHFTRRVGLGLPLTNPSTNTLCERESLTQDDTARMIIEKRLESLRPVWEPAPQAAV